MRLWVEKNDVEMYSTHNGGKYFVAEKFIRTLKKKIVSILLQYQNLYILIS